VLIFSQFHKFLAGKTRVRRSPLSPRSAPRPLCLSIFAEILHVSLLAIPAVLGSGAYEATRISNDPDVAWGAVIVATVIAFSVGYLVISWLIRYIATNSYLPFVLYRLGFAGVLVVLLLAGVLNA
jgi:hypothetical protein